MALEHDVNISPPCIAGKRRAKFCFYIKLGSNQRRLKFDHERMYSFDDTSVVRHDLTNGKSKAVSRAANQRLRQLGGDASFGATVVGNERGDVFKNLVKNTHGVWKVIIMLIGRFCRLVFHGQRSQADIFEAIAVCGRIGSIYTAILSMNCSSLVENRSNAVRQNGSNIILRPFC